MCYTRPWQTHVCVETRLGKHYNVIARVDGTYLIKLNIYIYIYVSIYICVLLSYNPMFLSNEKSYLTLDMYVVSISFDFLSNNSRI